ncbi:MAG: hypothetical protein SF182_21420 [Deltaproteobacteria bacterium]|nr:hypothetical protein [Deltaproteobacteria bacterium]
MTLDGAQGAIGLRLTIGSQRICTRFVDGAVSVDAAGKFTGSESLAVGDCDADTLRGYP